MKTSQKAQKALAEDGARDRVEAIAAALEAEAEFPPADFGAWTKAQCEALGVGMGKVMKPLRAALSGTLGGPELADILVLLGRERALQRLRALPVA